jgi:hypothetical protein
MVDLESGDGTLRVLSRHSPGEIKENDRYFSQDSRFVGVDSNSELFENDAGVPTTQPQRSLHLNALKT